MVDPDPGSDALVRARLRWDGLRDVVSPDLVVVLEVLAEVLDRRGRDGVSSHVVVAQGDGVRLPTPARRDEVDPRAQAPWSGFISFGSSHQELAIRFGRSRSWVSRRLALAGELPRIAVDAVRKGAVCAHAAMKYLSPVACDDKARVFVDKGEGAWRRDGIMVSCGDWSLAPSLSFASSLRSSF